ncbi:PilZ domain-containing protein [bacterium]|nr:PilZ domain-containing protein [bacterium]MBU3955016.1 PilZ domain-containing protein [bacterium]
MAERRIHLRFPTLSVIKTVEIHSTDGKTDIPAIMCDVSVGGLAMITFMPLPKNSDIVLDLNMPDINLHKVTAKIVRVEEKNGTFLIALEFSNLNPAVKKKINAMAIDWKKCEERMSVGEKIECPHCSYYNLCSKEVKKKHAAHQCSA